MSSIEQLLENLSKEELTGLKFDWQLWARHSQLAPTGSWTTWLLLGGRGAGKTRAGAEWIREKAIGLKPVSPIALVGENLSDARSVMIEGVSGLLAIHPRDQRPTFHRSRGELEWSNGVRAKLYSASDPDSLRGPQFSASWSDELAKWPKAEQAWDMLQFCMRVGEKPQQIVTTTPRPIKLLKRLLSEDQVIVTRIKTNENKSNLSPTFFKNVVGQYQNTALGRQELEGEMIETADDALWTRSTLENCRSPIIEGLECIVVAVDPPVSSHEKSDNCGIIVAGLLEDVVYVLADASIPRASPLKRASRVTSVYEQFEADCVVAEVNQGGDLVANALHQVHPNLPVKTVHAHRGKWLRAEPVAMLYERQRVKHCGMFAQLEDVWLEGTKSRGIRV